MIDRSGHKLLKPIIVICVISSIILSALEFFFPLNKVVVGICYGLNVVSMQFLIPMINSMSIYCPTIVNFGIGRACGSLVFAFVAFVVLVCLFPVKCGNPIVRIKRKDDSFFRRYPGFMTVMAGCTLVYFCQTLLNNNGYQDTTRGQAYITATYSIALIAGSPLGGFILQYFSVNAMLIVAGLCSIAGGAIMLAGIRKLSKAISH